MEGRWPGRLKRVKDEPWPINRKRKLPVILGHCFHRGDLWPLWRWSTFGNAKFKVEVCEGFNGRSICRNGAATTREEAQRIATVAACTDITSGMTQLMQCPGFDADSRDVEVGTGETMGAVVRRKY